MGIALPLDPPWLGLSVAFAVLSAWSLYVLTSAPRARLRAQREAEEAQAQAVRS